MRNPASALNSVVAMARTLLSSMSGYAPKCLTRIAPNGPRDVELHVIPPATTFSSAPGMWSSFFGTPANRARANETSASSDSSGMGR
jgi:hypothetical protein